MSKSLKRKRLTKAEREARQAAEQVKLARVEGKVYLGADAESQQFEGWVEYDEFNNWTGDINDNLIEQSYEVTWNQDSAQAAAETLRRAWQVDRAKLLSWRRASPRYVQKTKLH